MYNPIQIKMISDFTVERLEDLPTLRKLMEANNMKPNFSKIARESGVDRRTVKKYYYGYQKPKERRKASKIDAYQSIISELLSEDSVQTFHYVRHLWNYLVDQHNFPLTEGALRQYIKRHTSFQEYFNCQRHKSNSVRTLRYETSPGQQLQVDWKENFQYITRDGEIIKINILVALLGHSRYGIYHVTQSRRQPILFQVLNDVFEKMKGVPAEIVVDNMKTAMATPRYTYKKGEVNERFQQFAKDYNIEVKPCVATHAHTKGKIETQMKLLDEIDAYQGKFTFEELVAHVEKINIRKNTLIHPSTGKPPFALFEQEKSSLSPLPSKEIRSRYYYHQTAKVNASAMISYKSNQYSVPEKYIGKTLGLEVIDSTIYIYDSTNLIASHQVSQKKLNYLEAHYAERVKATMPYMDAESVKSLSKQNLERMSAIYDQK